MPDGSRRRQRVQRTAIERLVRSSAGGLLLRPWFDDAALRLLTQWYFPLSRAWAAALTPQMSPEGFNEAVRCGRFGRRLVPSILARAQTRLAAMAAADARWTESFFGDGPARADAEFTRLRAAAMLTGLRSAFLPLHLETPLRAVAFDVEAPDAVARRHGDRLLRPDRAFADVFGPASIEPSRGFLAPGGVEGWVRFPAPEPMLGTTWARVSSPAIVSGAGPRMPSLIFAHGIAMETEFTGESRNPLGGLLAAGIRVIRPEGPWHGRRRLCGTYGGEPVLARGPGGLLDYFQAHVIEIGRLVAWARATRGGPVAVGGVSLGALTAQLVAVAARHWPEEARPDALFLVAPSRSLTAVTFEGSLTRALGVPHVLRRAGWSLSAIDPWRPLMEPTDAPVVDAERTIVVLGASDDVTLTAGGEALVHAWKLPQENVFRSPAGHFSTSLGLARDDAPFRRLLNVLKK
jgi:hypothetical protein